MFKTQVLIHWRSRGTTQILVSTVVPITKKFRKPDVCTVYFNLQNRQGLSLLDNTLTADRHGLQI